MAINKLRYYLGPLGNVKALPPMVGGSVYPEAPIRIPGGVHTALSGRVTTDRSGIPKRSWVMTWENLTEVDRLQIDAAIYRSAGLPLRLIDPRSSNRLPADASTGGSLTLGTSAFTSAGNITDAFGSTSSSSWSPTDTGQSYAIGGGSAADYSKSGGLGRQSLGTVSVTRETTISAAAITDLDLTMSIATDKLATGASQAVGITFRNNGSGTYYAARVQFLTANFLYVELFRSVAAAITSIASFATVINHVANTRYFLRVQTAGSTLKVKTWRVVDPQPAAWTLSAVDTVITAAGSVTLNSLLFPGNTNALPVLATFDDLVLLSSPPLVYLPGSVPSALAGVLAGAQSWSGLFLNSQLNATSEKMPVLAGSTYTFSCYALGTAQVKLVARPFDVAGVEQTLAASSTQTLTGSYQRFSWVWTPSAGQVSAYFGLQAQGTGTATATGWQVVIDDAATPIPWAFGVGCPTVSVDPDVPASYWRAKHHRIKLVLREA